METLQINYALNINDVQFLDFKFEENGECIFTADITYCDKGV